MRNAPRHEPKRFWLFAFLLPILVVISFSPFDSPSYGNTFVTVEPEQKGPNSYFFVLNDKENNEVFGLNLEAFFKKHRDLRPRFVFNNDLGDFGQTIGYTVVVEKITKRDSTFFVGYADASDSSQTTFEDLIKKPLGTMLCVNPKKLVREGGCSKTVGYFFVYEVSDAALAR